jgi:hypothetical protein
LNLINLLYGKPLQLLIVEGLNTLNSQNLEKVSLSQISEIIINLRPELKVIINNSHEKQKLNKRILNTIKKLEAESLIKIEFITNKDINTTYYLIFTKIF